MNEPALFNEQFNTMPLEAIHKTSDGKIVEHRDLHNAYGLLSHKATYEGLMERDKHELR